MNKLIITLALALAAGTAQAGYYCDIDPDSIACDREIRREEREADRQERENERFEDRLREDQRDLSRAYRRIEKEVDRDQYVPRRRYYR